ncbi:MAG TPA: cell division protein SepF [Pseudonocardiaceae bacterium]|nr:cell division protein SepF [Pseudonocardiaceae bacterium]
MSALHRLKAYFGMVPAEEFDPEEFDAGEFGTSEAGAREFDAADVTEHQPRHARRAPNPEFARAKAYRADFDGDDDSVPVSAGHQSAARMHHAARTSSHASSSRVLSSRTAMSPTAMSQTGTSWGADAPVRGSLAITTANADASCGESGPASYRPSASPLFPSASRYATPARDAAHPLARIVTLQPHSYNEARPIGERYREGNPVIMNLTAMEDRDAKRLVDFAAGLAFALRGSIDKVTHKVFLLSPPDVEVSAEDRRRIAEGRPVR